MDNPPKYAEFINKTRPTLEKVGKKNQGEVDKFFSQFIKKEFK
jgi:hypothetical protein